MTDQLSNGNLLYQQQGLNVYENSLFRWLCFSDEKAIQSCMLKAEPASLNLAYQPFMMMWPLFVDEQPKKACLLGLGGGDLIRYLRDKYPETKLLAIEKEIAIARIASQYFFIKPDQEYLTIEMIDAERFIQKPQQHDLVLIDIVVDNNLPKFLYAEEFWLGCYNSLSTQGVLSFNVISESETLFKKLLVTLKQVFGHIPLCMGVPEHKNIVLMIMKSEKDMPTLKIIKQRSEELNEQGELPYARCIDIMVKDNEKYFDGMK